MSGDIPNPHPRDPDAEAPLFRRSLEGAGYVDIKDLGLSDPVLTTLDRLARYDSATYEEMEAGGVDEDRPIYVHPDHYLRWELTNWRGTVWGGITARAEQSKDPEKIAKAQMANQTRQDNGAAGRALVELAEKFEGVDRAAQINTRIAYLLRSQDEWLMRLDTTKFLKEEAAAAHFARIIAEAMGKVAATEPGVVDPTGQQPTDNAQEIWKGHDHYDRDNPSTGNEDRRAVLRLEAIKRGARNIWAMTGVEVVNTRYGQPVTSSEDRSFMKWHEVADERFQGEEDVYGNLTWGDNVGIAVDLGLGCALVLRKTTKEDGSAKDWYYSAEVISTHRPDEPPSPAG